MKDEDVAPPSLLSDSDHATAPASAIPPIVPSGTPKRKVKGRKSVYVIYVGLEVGVYYDW